MVYAIWTEELWLADVIINGYFPLIRQFSSQNIETWAEFAASFS